MTETIENNKLFIWNLHWDVRWQDLKEHFSQFGEVAYASVSLDRETKRSRGFGFVTFVNAEDAQRAMDEANETEFKGRPLYISQARARDESPAPESHGNDDSYSDDME